MTNAELILKIRAEIERLKEICTAQIKANPGQTFPFVMEMTGYDKLLSFLSDLEESERPEPYNPVYDEAYLNEKIKKATESWKGVDVDAMLAECRGYDEEESEKPSEGLEEEINLAWEKLEKDYSPSALDKTIIIVSGLVGEKQFSNIARHFAQWGAEHLADARKMIEPPCHTVDEWIEHIKNADQLTKDIFSKGPYNVLYDALNHPYQHCYDAIKEFGELCYASGLQDKQEHSSVPNDLGEAAGEYAEKHGFRVPYDGSDNFYDDIDVKASKEGFIAGAKWQKEQDEKEQADLFTIVALDAAQRAKDKMLKEAVEGFIFQAEDYYPKELIARYDGELKHGDKVRVIVLPKEDKK